MITTELKKNFNGNVEYIVKCVLDHDFFEKICRGEPVYSSLTREIAQKIADKLYPKIYKKVMSDPDLNTKILNTITTILANKLIDKNKENE